MGRRSKHLGREERGVIFAERIRSGSHRVIGRLLGRSARTIGCELARRLKIDIRLERPARALAARQQQEHQRPSAQRLISRINRLTLEVRQFMPKGTDLSDASQTWLNDVAARLNNRPRKTLGWRTPVGAMAEERAAFRSTVVRDA